jgi:hypothetical protein
LSKCALKLLAELFGGIFSWPPAPTFHSHFMRNLSDPLPGEERVIRLNQFHNFVDADGRVLPLLTEDEFCHIGFPEPGQPRELELGIHFRNQLLVGHPRTPLPAGFEHHRSVVHIEGSIVSRTVGPADGAEHCGCYAA